MNGFGQMSYAVYPSIRIRNSAAESYFNSCLAVNNNLALKKPGIAYVFIKGDMHPDRIAGFHLSFEFCFLYPGQDGGLPPACLDMPGFLQHLGHEQGPGLKNRFTKQNSGHYGIPRIMARKNIKVRCNEFFRNNCCCIARDYRIDPEKGRPVRNCPVNLLIKVHL